jgi:hypothetical protein
MNTTRVSISAARRLGTILTIILLSLAVSHARAGDIYITANGTVSGEDYLHVFALGGFLRPESNIPKGMPFKLMFTFDDATGEPITTRCANSGSGVMGIGEHSPGAGSVMIDDASYAFGRKDNAHSRIWRGVPSSCGNGGGMAIRRKRWPQAGDEHDQSQNSSGAGHHQVDRGRRLAKPGIAYQVFRAGRREHLRHYAARQLRPDDAGFSEGGKHYGRRSG